MRSITSIMMGMFRIPIGQKPLQKFMINKAFIVEKSPCPFIPIHWIHILQEVAYDLNATSLLLPIYANPVPPSRRNSQARDVVADLCTGPLQSCGLIHYKVKDIDYYAGRGIIFDKDFSLIAATGYRVPVSEGFNDLSVILNSLNEHTEHAPILMLDSSVYSESDPVRKYIKTKVLPEIFRFHYDESLSLLQYNGIGTPIKVEVSDLKSLIYETKEVGNVAMTDDILNQLLSTIQWV